MPTIIKTTTPPLPGKVYLVGAGPGAIDLITVRGAKLLAQADVVLYDALVCAEMLTLCPQAQLVAVGKRAGQRSVAQEAINQQIISAAQQHAFVVRLKGGDPMLFGRADEELRALEDAGISYEIVPGITTAFAAAASSRQPLTRRGIARSVAFFTSTNGLGEPEQENLPSCDTLVQYMGGREAIATAERLLAQGYAPDMPIVAIENCSRPDERIFRLTLAQMVHGLPETSGPVLVMLGWAMAPRHPI
ncbi:MAG: uroporphyrinogen-III C-methyltransferase [Burkholderiales bacterium]|nr:uroporphyrinogen-III C-methyltransferase [Burkholderiales bacterium]